MGDMAWVSTVCLGLSHITYYLPLRFGGGTEMLRDGDRDGLWKLLKAGMRQISPSRFLEYCLTIPQSSSHL